jgi:hypothetical protein
MRGAADGAAFTKIAVGGPDSIGDSELAGEWQLTGGAFLTRHGGPHDSGLTSPQIQLNTVLIRGFEYIDERSVQYQCDVRDRFPFFGESL